MSAELSENTPVRGSLKAFWSLLSGLVILASVGVWRYAELVDRLNLLEYKLEAYKGVAADVDALNRESAANKIVYENIRTSITDIKNEFIRQNRNRRNDD